MVIAPDATPEAKAIYKQRSQTVELRFADGKSHRGLRRFSGRGLKRVRIEVGLWVLSHNLLVVWRAGQRKAAVDASGATIKDTAQAAAGKQLFDAFRKADAKLETAAAPGIPDPAIATSLSMIRLRCRVTVGDRAVVMVAI